jgi:hypothetical protein
MSNGRMLAGRTAQAWAVASQVVGATRCRELERGAEQMCAEVLVNLARYELAPERYS